MTDEQHVPGLEIAKAWMLVPPAFLGFMMGMFFVQPLPRNLWAAAIIVGFVALFHLPMIALFAWTYGRGGRVIGHTWFTWLVLTTIAYGLGFAANFLPD
jgi:hypothetical protein